MNTTFDEVLATVAEAKAKNREVAIKLIDPEALRRHLRLALTLAGFSFLAVVVIASATRLLPMTDKQVALWALVALTAAGSFVIALLSAGSAAGAAFAHQRAALREALERQEWLRCQERQANIDATEEVAKNQETSLAMQVGVDLMWAELRDRPSPDRATLEEVCRYMELLSAHNRGLAAEPTHNAALAMAGLRVFRRYETVLQGSLTQQSTFRRMKATFEKLKPA